MVTKDEMELLAVLARIGQTDRALYRQLRAEVWALVQDNHSKKTPGQLEQWMRNAS